jgi:hypothetical protein
MFDRRSQSTHYRENWISYESPDTAATTRQKDRKTERQKDDTVHGARRSLAMESSYSLERIVLSQCNPWGQPESNDDAIPRSFTHVDKYKAAFEPKLLEEVRESISAALKHAIGMSR